MDLVSMRFSLATKLEPNQSPIASSSQAEDGTILSFVHDNSLLLQFNSIQFNSVLVLLVSLLKRSLVKIVDLLFL